MLVVSLAKTSNLLFGGTADFEVARDFAVSASYDEKLALHAMPVRGGCGRGRHLNGRKRPRFTASSTS